MLATLNRVYPEKTTTVVLDFVNEASEIQKAFQPYCDRTVLNEATDPNQLYNLQNQLEGYEFYEPKDLERFALVYFNPKSTQDKLYQALNPVVDRYQKAYAEEQREFRSKLKDSLSHYRKTLS